jgi:hypothetical protein
MHDKDNSYSTFTNSMNTRSMGILQAWNKEYDEDDNDDEDDEVVSSCKTDAPVVVSANGSSNDQKEGEEQEDSPNCCPLLTLKGLLTRDSILKKRGAGRSRASAT